MLEKSSKINVPKTAITIKRTTNPTQSPAIDNKKTVKWNTKAGEQMIKNVKEAAKGASVRGNLQPMWGKQLVLDFQTHPSSFR